MENVLIVGAGPTGLTLAINLLRNGINCTIIDKRRTASSDSKAITANAATLKLYHNIGIIDKFIEHGCIVNDIYVHWNSRKLMHVNYQNLEGPYKYFLSIPQPESEKILLQYFSDLGGNVNFETELMSIDNSDHNLIDVGLRSNGIVYNKRIKYLIGCDGAKSRVRDIIGSEFTGRDYEMFFELIDVYLDWDGKSDATHYFVVEDCFVIIIPMIENKHRIVIKNNIENIEDMRAEKPISYYENIINKCGVSNLKIKSIFWRSFSKFYNRLIDKYDYKQRVFFAGDACHLFSPIGGLGMNTGVQDAFNLSWRLSGILSDKYNVKILEEYHNERKFIGKDLINSTDKSTELITRINTQDNTSLAHWLPTMQNRKNIKHVFPLNFSGLSHNYMLDGKEIYHVPFANGLNTRTRKNISTYDMVNGIDFNILLFVNQEEIGKHHSLTQELLKLNGIKLWQITDTLDANGNHPDYFTILDKYGEFYSKCAVRDSNTLIIRPDGYVGLVCNIQDTMVLQHYLKYYFSGIQ